ncbi:hypothetical protein VTI74DRAFT_7297 [Chaetomium olivicolor]
MPRHPPRPLLHHHHRPSIPLLLIPTPRFSPRQCSHHLPRNIPRRPPPRIPHPDQPFPPPHQHAHHAHQPQPRRPMQRIIPLGISQLRPGAARKHHSHQVGHLALGVIPPTQPLEQSDQWCGERALLAGVDLLVRGVHVQRQRESLDEREGYCAGGRGAGGAQVVGRGRCHGAADVAGRDELVQEVAPGGLQVWGGDVADQGRGYPDLGVRGQVAGGEVACVGGPRAEVGGKEAGVDGGEELIGGGGVVVEGEAGRFGEVAEDGFESGEGEGGMREETVDEAVAGAVQLGEVEAAAGQVLGEVGQLVRGEVRGVQGVEEGLAALVGQVEVRGSLHDAEEDPLRRTPSRCGVKRRVSQAVPGVGLFGGAVEFLGWSALHQDRSDPLVDTPCPPAAAEPHQFLVFLCVRAASGAVPTDLGLGCPRGAGRGHTCQGSGRLALRPGNAVRRGCGGGRPVFCLPVGLPSTRGFSL